MYSHQRKKEVPTIPKTSYLQLPSMDVTLDGITYHLVLYTPPDGERDLLHRLSRLMAQELEAVGPHATPYSLISLTDKE